MQKFKIHRTLYTKSLLCLSDKLEKFCNFRLIISLSMGMLTYCPVLHKMIKPTQVTLNLIPGISSCNSEIKRLNYEK